MIDLHGEFPSLFDEPVSTDNPEFRQLIQQSLAKSMILVGLLRYANCGGGKDYFIVRHLHEFDAMMTHLRAKDSLSVFFPSNFPVGAIASLGLVPELTQLMELNFAEYDGIDLLRLDAKECLLDNASFGFVQNPQELREWLEEHLGAPMLAGTMPFWKDNGQDVVSVYAPDADGVIRPGAY